MLLGHAGSHAVWCCALQGSIVHPPDVQVLDAVHQVLEPIPLHVEVLQAHPRLLLQVRLPALGLCTFWWCGMNGSCIS